MQNPNPDPNSKRSKKRKSRGFISLEKSSRKHRRAFARRSSNGTIGANYLGNGGHLYAPGTPVDPPTQGKEKTFTEKTSGKLNYH